MSKKFLSPIKLAQGASNPSSGSAGEIFYNTTDKAIYTHNGTGWGVTESSIPAGTIVQWGGSTAPTNWLLCDGTAVSRTTYATLFAAIGTSYGTGDGSTTFNLPDLRGRVPVGKNGGTFATLGNTGGAETVTLAITNLPSHTHTGTTATSGNHTHTYSGSTNTTGAHTHQLQGSNGGSAGVSMAVTGNTNNDFGYGPMNGARANSAGDHSHTFSGTTSDVSTTHTHTFTTDATGSGTAINNLQPYQVVNYIIKTTSGTTAGDSPLTARVSAIETTTVRSVALGGTGASTASAALTNLGAAPIASPTFTGTATAPVLASTVANGTAPLTVTSATAVANFNADMVDGYHESSMLLTRSDNLSTNSTDFNTIVTPGSYVVGGNGNWTGSTNGPTSAYSYGQLVVTANGSLVNQTYYAHSTGGHYVRTKFNASDWQAWQRLSSNYTTTAVANGGTGATTLASGGYLKGAGTAAITSQSGIPASDITSGQFAHARMPAGTVVGFNRIRTTARSAYGYNGDTILSDLNISITPKFSNSLLLVQWQVMYESDYNSVFRVYRDNGLVYTSGYQGYNEADGSGYSGIASLQYDTDVASTPSNQMVQYFVPAGNTNATTLQLSVRSSYNTAATFYLNRTVNSGGSNAYEIGVSTAVIWEIAQ